MFAERPACDDYKTYIVILQFKICLFVCGISLTSGQLIIELFPDTSTSQPEFHDKPPITSFELPSDVFLYIQALLDAMRPPIALEAPQPYLALPAPPVVELVSQPVSIFKSIGQIKERY